MSNSAEAIKLGFNKSDASRDNKEDKKESPVKDQTTVSAAVPDDNENDDEYTDIRSVTIMLIKNYSLYRRVNDKTLPKRRDYIGSSVYSSRALSANKEEVETYFPNIIGLSATDPNFVMRVKQYLNNIRVSVDELGRTFDISFHYYHKKDYYKIKREEEKIEEAYQRSNRQDITNLRKALKEKINKLHALEGTKCKLGYPINVDEYLMYRHCLLYNDVAKDVALINADPSIRFYFKDDQKEANQKAKFRIEVNKAKANYVSCLADDKLFDAIYTQFCVLKDMPLISSLAENRVDREIKLDKFSTEEPVKFNKIFNNKDLKLMATIEMLIARGELVRSDYNQNISTREGEFVGANIGEAVVWFKNPENISAVNAYKNKLNNM